ncbi:MAG TPA: regulatory protein RecX [Gammaproteobacteria bacterium]|nr:regulatory protein RecX [Gammaproteobacteria bacterium]
MSNSSKPEPSSLPRGDPAACEQAAVALLARREHSRLELERKLEARAFEAEAIAAALDRLESAELLSDRRFVRSFVESRASRGFGPVRIRAELAQRGIAADAAAESLRDAGQDWDELARRARLKRFGEDLPKEFKARARQAQFLQYRGFEASQVDAALHPRGDTDCADLDE